MLAGRRSRHRHASPAALVRCFFFTFALAHSAFAQITAATVSGTITDQTGAVLRGVAIVVTNTDTVLTRSGLTDAKGNFTVPSLPPGPYEVRASLQGFGTAVARVTLSVAQEAGLNLRLNVTGTEQSVMVMGVSPIVDTRSATLSAVVTEKTISELPLNGRNYMELALLQPGVASFNEKDSGAGSSNRGTKLNINGMTFRSNSYLLDGANMRGYPGTRHGVGGRDDAWCGNDSGISRRDQRVFRRLRPRNGRRRQSCHEERNQQGSGIGLRVLPR